MKIDFSTVITLYLAVTTENESACDAVIKIGGGAAYSL